ncbi:hypothetical protein GE21DRAFT_1123271 [Neurospora crassa]|nr:hypothetical protein GE21DRAFT_1123271 [Neurospora crassa]
MYVRSLEWSLKSKEPTRPQEPTTRYSIVFVVRFPAPSSSQGIQVCTYVVAAFCCLSLSLLSGLVHG